MISNFAIVQLKEFQILVITNSALHLLTSEFIQGHIQSHSLFL